MQSRKIVSVIAAAALLIGLLLPTASILADTTAQGLPFSQNWGNADLITVSDDWSAVPGITGYRGDGLTALTGADPQTIVADGTAVLDVNANQTNPDTFSTGGVTEFAITNPTVALTGSGTADAPFILITLNTTGAASIQISYNLRDLDGSVDDAIQQVALQYRVGTTGDFTNLPAGYVADATTGPSLATLVTPVSVTLPAAVDNQPLVQVRIITTNAVGNDEWVGIDDIVITASESAPSVTGTTPANGANGVAVDANIVVNFNEPVNAAVGAFTISCTDTGVHTYTVTEGNPSNVFTLNPDVDFSAVDVCTVTVDDTAIEDADSNDPPGTMVTDYVFSFSIPVLDMAPTVTATTPTSGATGVDQSTDLIVTFSEDVTTAADWYTLECPVGSAVASTWTGTGSSRTIDPTASLPGSTNCSVVIDAAQVTDLDGTADPMAADFPWSFSTNACFTVADSIASIQGTTDTSPLAGSIVTIEGVVTGDFQATGRLGGFFVQSTSPDADPLTSEGIFVYNTAFAVNPGDYVRLSATVAEYLGTGGYGHMNHQTQLGSVTDPLLCATGQSVAPTVLNLPLAPTADPAVYLERYESMLVTIPDTLTVQQNYFQGRFGQITLGAGGRVINHLNGTGGSFTENLRRMLVLDDGSTWQNVAPIPYYSADGALRAGDTVTGLTGLLDQGEINSDSAPTAFFPDVYYRLHPTVAPVFNTVARPASPPDVGGRLQVASFNVLNYFTTLGSRGADSEKEFVRQHQKLVNAICALDADVVGLMEIENNGAAAVNTLIEGYTGLADPYTGIEFAGLNDVADCGPYAVISDPPLGYGTDEIKVTIIYRPGVVQAVGGSISTNAAPFDEYRHPVAQTFQELSSGSFFSVVVNHFKSKGCSGTETGGDVDLGVEGGCYNATRVEMANVLLDWIATTLLPADPDVLVIGDLNAYGGEDPIDALTAGGLTDQVASHLTAVERYSYVFDGMIGYLDHALSTANLDAQITGVNYWHINADEPSVIDYIDDYKVGGTPSGTSPDLWLPHVFRSSDHDPVLIGLSLYWHHYLPIIFR